MKKIILKLAIITAVLIGSTKSYAQNSVGIGTSSPDTNAVLHLVSVNGKQGILVPRVADRSTITGYTAAQNGMLIYETNTNAFYYWDGASWMAFGGSDADWTMVGNQMYNNTHEVGIKTTNPITSLQIGDKFHLDSTFGGAFGYMGRNVNVDGAGNVVRTEAGSGQFFYLGDNGTQGQMGLQTYPPAAAGANTNFNMNLEMGDSTIYMQRQVAGISADRPAVIIEPGGNNKALYVLGMTQFGDSGGNNVGIMSNGVKQNYVLTLPDSLPSNPGDVLASDASGNLYWMPTGGGVNDVIIDADGDTYIRVENTPDEDKIVFSTGNSGNIPMVFFDMDSGRFNVYNTGQSVFIGEAAGASDDLSANQNTYVGYFAGNANATGLYNTAMGSEALRNSTGNSNTAFGQGALKQNLGGGNNTAVGVSTLTSNTTGSANVAVGQDALWSNTTQNGNTAVGYRTLFNNAGSNNTSLGYDAGYSNVATVGNLYLGYYAGRSGTTGNYNIMAGYTAGQLSSGGSYNILMGYGAGYNNSGSYNVIQGNRAGYNNSGLGGVHLGNYAGYSNTTANYNVNIGYYAGFGNQTGNQNINIGEYAGRFSDVAFNSIHMGYYAGRYDSASYNITVGYFAGSALTTGTQNTIIGGNSTGSSNVSGSYNTYLGSAAGQLGTANGNTMVGYYAGRNTSSGGFNTALGYQAGDFNTIGSTNTFIGYAADASSNNLANATAIGANATVDGSNMVILGNGANVGIGVSNATQPLTIMGNGGIRPVGITQNNVGGTATMELTTTDAANNQSTRIKIGGNGNTPDVDFYSGAFGSETSIVHIEGTNGNLGVGVVAPSARLDVAGDINYSNAISVGSNYGIAGQVLTSAGGGVNTWTTPVASTNMYIADGSLTSARTVTQGANTLTFNLSGTGDFQIQDAGVTQFVVFDNGDIGMDNTTMYVDASANKVGIGTILPSHPLHINENGVNPYANFTDNVTGTTSSDGLIVGTNGAGTAYIVHQETLYDLNIGNSTSNNALTVDGPTAYIGINTSAPSEQLEVVGNIEIPAANDYKYATAKTNYASVAASGFTLSDGSSGVYMDGFDSGNARWIVGGTPITEYMYAPIQLPHGATVTNLDFYVYDADGTYQCSGNLSRQTLGGTIVSAVATTPSSGAASVPGTTTLSTTANHVVDNSTYSYFLRFTTTQANNNLRIYGARVTYTVTKAD